MSLESAAQNLASLAQELSDQMRDHALRILETSMDASTTPAQLRAVVQQIEADLLVATTGWAQISARLSEALQ